MKKIFTFCFLCLSISSIGQVNLDSLWAVWEDPSQPDTSRLQAKHKIAWDGYLFSIAKVEDVLKMPGLGKHREQVEKIEDALRNYDFDAAFDALKQITMSN